ncbi:MAG TPA: lysozyme [Candidatus Ratteibacteria bacterium]|nr:lysozyme [Candidatus Ratteibacteria bacterium]
MSKYKISHRGLKLIAGYEGFRAKPYICAGGFPTIGFGHKILSNEKFSEITFQEAEEILRKDCEIAEQAVNKMVKVEINQDIFDALVSFAFNVGAGNFEKSSVLKNLNKSDYYNCALSFCLWNKAGGKILQGLINRRAEEQLIFTIGAVKMDKLR